MSWGEESARDSRGRAFIYPPSPGQCVVQTLTAHVCRKKRHMVWELSVGRSHEVGVTGGKGQGPDCPDGFAIAQTSSPTNDGEHRHPTQSTLPIYLPNHPPGLSTILDPRKEYTKQHSATAQRQRQASSWAGCSSHPQWVLHFFFSSAKAAPCSLSVGERSELRE